jgi:hypothetical protein
MVSRPSSIAMMLKTAKQVMNAATRLKLSPNAATKGPATNGPKLVMTRALPVQNPTAVELIPADCPLSEE